MHFHNECMTQMIIFFMNFYVQKDGKINTKEYEGQEVLCIRAYGSSFFALGINTRFVLH